MSPGITVLVSVITIYIIYLRHFITMFNWIWSAIWKRESAQPSVINMKSGGFTGTHAAGASLYKLHDEELVLPRGVSKTLLKLAHKDKGLPKALSTSIKKIYKRKPQPVSQAEWRRVCAAHVKSTPVQKRKAGVAKKRSGTCGRKTGGKVQAVQLAPSQHS